MNNFSIRNIFLSILYVIIAAILILLVNMGLGWFLNNIALPILNWFNNLNFFFKLFLLLIGGMSLFISLLTLTSKLTTILGGLIFNKLPQNYFTLITSFILAIGNAIWNIYLLWTSDIKFNFWSVCELIILSFFVLSFSAIILPAKDQMSNYTD